MQYELVIPPSMVQDLNSHLLGDRTKEQMAVMLCGKKRAKGCVSLLGRHLIVMPAEAFSHQSAGSLELHPAVQSHVLQLAADEGLSQVDWHTHPGDGPTVGFSGIDDHNESKLAMYLQERLPGTLYASVVLNSEATAARVWEMRNRRPVPVAIPAPNLECPTQLSHLEEHPSTDAFNDGRFDRQIRAFGLQFQHRLRSLRVGVVGLGGLGSIIVEQLARLGVQDWVLVDPDRVEASNLNRLLGATLRDVTQEATKVAVAARNIQRIDTRARVKALACSVFSPRALKALKACDLLIVATDNEASRLVVNALACQYLISLVHAGVNLEPGDDGTFHDVSGEFAIPSLGDWCLLCAGIIDAQRATWDLAGPEERAILAHRGYLTDVPAPAVYHLNGVVASLAVTEIHNLVWPYKPLKRYLVYRELEGELMALKVARREFCAHCGPEGLLGLGDLAPLWNPQDGRTLRERGLPSPDATSAEELQSLITPDEESEQALPANTG